MIASFKHLMYGSATPSWASISCFGAIVDFADGKYNNAQQLGIYYALKRRASFACRERMT